MHDIENILEILEKSAKTISCRKEAIELRRLVRFAGHSIPDLAAKIGLSDSCLKNLMILETCSGKTREKLRSWISGKRSNL